MIDSITLGEHLRQIRVSLQSQIDLYRRGEDKRQNLLRQLEIITDIVKESNETCLSQIEMMKNTI